MDMSKTWKVKAIHKKIIENKDKVESAKGAWKAIGTKAGNIHKLPELAKKAANLHKAHIDLNPLWQ